MWFHWLLKPPEQACVHATGVLGMEIPHGPEYICLAVMVLVGMGIVAIAFYFGFWGRK